MAQVGEASSARHSALHTAPAYAHAKTSLALNGRRYRRYDHTPARRPRPPSLGRTLALLACVLIGGGASGWVAVGPSECSFCSPSTTSRSPHGRSARPTGTRSSKRTRGRRPTRRSRWSSGRRSIPGRAAGGDTRCARRAGAANLEPAVGRLGLSRGAELGFMERASPSPDAPISDFEAARPDHMNASRRATCARTS
jgi:hypothetical protein